MRVISGKLGSRKLFTPGDTIKVRPTGDRTKEAMFNMLDNITRFGGKKVLDIFCGTGALGIEAISRGAEFGIFVDKDTKLVVKNLEALSITDKSKIVRIDFEKYLSSVDFEVQNVDLVFADPPYEFPKYENLIEVVSKKKCIFILEHENEINFMNEKIIKHRKAGRALISIYDFRK